MFIETNMYIEFVPVQATPWTSRASGRQTERADCNYVFEKLTFLEKSFNKDKSIGL